MPTPSLFSDLLVFIFVLSFLVIIHELGHFLIARILKVKVEEFGLGYPPRATKLFTWAGTVFSLNWVPFGGFVKLEGEDVIDADEEPPHDKKTKDDPDHQPFYKKGAMARLSILLAGAGVNFLFGIIAFSIYFSVNGIPTLLPVNNPRIGRVADNSPAAAAKVATGVDITAIQIGQTVTPIKSIDEVTSFVAQHLGEHATIITTGECEVLKCEQKTQRFDVYLRRKSETPDGQGPIGIGFDPIVQQTFYPWYEMPWKAAIYGTQQALLLTYFIIISLGQIIALLFRGHVPAEVSGPVGIFTEGRKAGFFSHGILELLNFMGLLSVNLAIMNVLPIPALDGGRAFFILLEKIVGKKYIHKIENYANYGGFALLIVLIVLVTAKDLWGAFHS